MARRRGGYQKPSKPAAVSGPGALSARTDGRVPATLPSGGDYGDRKALAEQQSAAPMSPQAGPAGGGVPSGAAAAGPPGFGAAGVFSPTERPGEPPTAGVDFGPGAGAPGDGGLGEDPYMWARALYNLAPTPELERLIARLARA
jgi:hypothetical protein